MGKKNSKKKKKTKSTKKKSDQPHSESLPIESLPSIQSIESILAGLGDMGENKRNDVNEAQQIIYDAWEAPTRLEAVALAKKALTVSADCADAYNLLAEETARSLEEAIDLYRKGVEAGERALGKEAFEEDVGHFWGLLETRPYMRARAGLAECLWETGQREEAVEHCWDLLRLNPNDNQGIRDLLMPCLIELGREEDAEKLFKMFKQNPMAVWKYSRALLDFRKHGNSPVANESLSAALRQNEHVPSYLLGRKQLPATLPAYYGFGDVNEAVTYVSYNRQAWKTSSRALDWLAGSAK